MTVTNTIRAEFRPYFDQNTDEWVILVDQHRMKELQDDSHKVRFQVRLPLYLTRTYLSLGSTTIRPQKQKYTRWLLKEQGGICAACGSDFAGGDLILDHQPPLSRAGSKLIDYERATGNRFIHRHCDPAQRRKPLRKPDAP